MIQYFKKLIFLIISLFSLTAITAQGFSSCMMEGFDEPRVKKILGLKYSDRVVMVISVGEEAERGTWGPRFRISSDKVIHEV